MGYTVKKSEKPEETIWSFAFAGFIFMSAVLCVGASIVIPVIPNIMREYDVSSNFITAAFATLIIGRFISAFFTGYILIWIRPHKLLLAGLFLHFCTMVLLMSAQTGLAFSTLRFFEGIFEGIVTVILQVMVIGLSTKKDRGVKMGYMQSAFGVGFIVGPVISGFAMKFMGPKGVFGVVALLVVICIIWLLLIHNCIDKQIGAPKPRKAAFSLEFIKFFPFYGGPIIQRILMVSFSMLIPLFLVDRFLLEPYEVGFFFTLSALITATMMPFTGRFGKSKYCCHIVTAAMVIMALAILGMGVAKTQLGFTIFYIIETIGFAVMAPNAMKIFADKVEGHNQSTEIIGTSSSMREGFNILIIFCLIPIYEYNKLLPWIMLAFFCTFFSIPYMKNIFNIQQPIKTDPD